MQNATQKNRSMQKKCSKIHAERFDFFCMDPASDLHGICLMEGCEGGKGGQKGRKYRSLPLPPCPSTRGLSRDGGQRRMQNSMQNART